MSALKIDAPRRENDVLDGLSVSQFVRLRPFLQPVAVAANDILDSIYGGSRSVYFPLTCVLAPCVLYRSGATFELASIGREGIALVPMFDRDDAPSVQTVVRAGGRAYRVDADAFETLAIESPGMRDLVARYVSRFVMQLAQTAACNYAHPIAGRTARALLVLRDQLETDTFAITHEQLAEILGARRATITFVMRRLRKRELVTYHRGTMTLTDVAGLEAIACECTAALRERLRRAV